MKTKIESAVKRETAYIAVWVLILSILMESVFLVIGKWDLTVLYGNLLSGTLSILNFFLMGLTVQKAVKKEEKQAKSVMKLSMLLRLLLVFAAAALGALLPCFNVITSLLPLFFPRLAIAFHSFFDKKKNKGSSQDKEGEDKNE